MLTIACVWFRGSVYDSPEWVVRLYSMVRRNIGCKHWPFRFVCITPHGDELAPWGEYIITVPPKISVPEGWPLWWHKLDLVNLGVNRVLYLDLDTVILSNISPLVDFQSSFALSPCSSVPSKGKDLNSSVMVFDCNGEQANQIRKLLPPDFKRFPGDQQWLCSLPVRLDVFPSRWVRKYLPGKINGKPPDGTIVSLMIQGGKNQALIEAGHSWIEEYWR